MTEATGETPFITAVNKVLERFSPRRKMSPAQLLTFWEQFVNAALAGYRAGWYDFDNERRIRNVIEAVLADPGVRRFAEAGEWSRAVEEVDRRYRTILIPMADLPSDRPWWLTGVPRYAGPELASDLKRLHDTEVVSKA